jgi:hypothetical protein
MEPLGRSGLRRKGEQLRTLGTDRLLRKTQAEARAFTEATVAFCVAWGVVALLVAFK